MPAANQSQKQTMIDFYTATPAKIAIQFINQSQ